MQPHLPQTRFSVDKIALRTVSRRAKRRARGRGHLELRLVGLNLGHIIFVPCIKNM